MSSTSRSNKKKRTVVKPAAAAKKADPPKKGRGAPPKEKKERFKLEPVNKNPEGRPRKDGSPARKRKRSLPMTVRRDIKRMIQDNATVAEIKLKHKRYAPTTSQIDAIKYGKVKLVSEPRSDSFESPKQTGRIRKYDDPVAAMREVLVNVSNDLESRTGYTPEDSADILVRLSLVSMRLQKASLVNSLGRRDADVVLAIIRMYEPNATQDEAIQIYKQALATVQNEE
jgi:hypothetical protein